MKKVNKVPARRSLAIAQGGITNDQEFIKLAGALIVDVLGGKLNAGTMNAACNGLGKILKVVDMRYRYGREVAGRRVLQLTDQAGGPR